MTENTIHTIRIMKIVEECENIKSLFFNVPLHNPKPGQFLMVWMPGIDEIPMSISSWKKNNYWVITVKNVGECTKKLSEVNVNDFIGVRGPLGNHFNLPRNDSSKIVIIGGGIGAAPLRFLAQNLISQNKTFTYIEGAKSEDDLFLKNSNEFNKTSQNEFLFCTDDGSFGQKGFASEILKKYLEELPKSILQKTKIFTCGPEIMMYKIYKICSEYKIPLQASLERVMRCGCGICGLCAVDPKGLLVCKDGPIFNYEQLHKMDDFGKYKRNFTGKKIKIDD